MAGSTLYSNSLPPKLQIVYASATHGNRRRLSLSTRTTPRSGICCSSMKDRDLPRFVSSFPCPSLSLSVFFLGYSIVIWFLRLSQWVRFIKAIYFIFSNFCIIEGPETVQDFVQMQSQEIQDNIRSRRNKIFLLMEEVKYIISIYSFF